MGVVIKPYRVYAGRRLKSSFYEAIVKQNRMVATGKKTSSTGTIKKPAIFYPSRPSPSGIQSLQVSDLLHAINSYLGVLKHYQTYKLRRTFLFGRLNPLWWNYVYVRGGFAKLVPKIKGSTFLHTAINR